jgi:signal peptide peptidase SppA
MVKRLEKLLNDAIDRAETEDRPRAQIINEMAVAAGIDEGPANEARSICPGRNQSGGDTQGLRISQRAAPTHDISRVLRAVATGAWFIDARKGNELLSVLALRADGLTPGFEAREEASLSRMEGRIAVLRLHGVITPRADMLSEMSGAVSLERFRGAFREAARDPDVRAIVLDIDSPGGRVDFVPETVADIRKAHSADRPIIAVANNLAASAAYWIAAAADEIVVTPSGEVGAIGVYMLHEDISEQLVKDGIKKTFIFEGPRKIEGNPFQPLDATARAALQRQVTLHYESFILDIASFRGAPVANVRADPESTDRHFGGGRMVGAKEAVRLGMADSIATIEATIELVASKHRRRPRAAIERRRLALI